MSASSQTALGATFSKGLVLTDTGAVRAGEERVYALNKLKTSPRNARKAGHSPSVVEQRAASILAKGLLQMPVVEPERRADGTETGYGLVTIGEGRRLALRLLAKRKLIPKNVPVRCLVDTVNDPAEISLDENISRAALHPADEFEAFKDLADRLGWGAEAIGARFGVTAAVVRQRLRLGAVAPALVKAYRGEALTLDQLMAFAVSEDHERQLQVFQTHAHAQPFSIRRTMTEATVAATDRRVVFVGLDAYVAAGGTVIRDLFTEDGGGYLSDPALLDRLVAEKLAGLAQGLRDAEGWKWAEAHLDYPHGHGLARIWPRPVSLSEARAAESDALRQEYEALSEAWGGVEDLPSEIEARLADIEARLAQDQIEAYDPVEQARAGVWVVLGYDGDVRIERGLVRAEDVPAPEPEPQEEDGATGDDAQDEARAEGAEETGEHASDGDEPEGDAGAPLSMRLASELTAHRSAGLRLALSNDPDLALVVLTHALVVTTFHHRSWASCLDVKVGSAFLPEYGEGVKTNPAHEAMETRFGQWAAMIPGEVDEAWAFIVGLDADSRASLLAFCVARSLNAARVRPQADALATAMALDMAQFWTPTAERYLARVSKAHVLAAVAEAVSPDTAERLSGARKIDLVAAAEPELVKARWLPSLLRTAPLVPTHAQGEGAGQEGEPDGAAAPKAGAGDAPDEAAPLEAMAAE